MNMTKKQLIKLLNEVRCSCGENEDLDFFYYLNMFEVYSIKICCKACKKCSDVEMPILVYTEDEYDEDVIKTYTDTDIDNLIIDINKYFDSKSPLDYKREQFLGKFILNTSTDKLIDSDEEYIDMPETWISRICDKIFDDPE